MPTSMPVGLHVAIREMPAARTYVVTTGERHLHGLEDGDIRCWPDTHVFMLNEATGDIAVHGDHGTFAFCWTESMRGGRTLKAFLANLSFDYFMTKASTKPHMVADIDATIVRMKREVLEERRSGELDKAAAKEIWDCIDLYLDPGQSRDEFLRELCESSTLYDHWSDGGPNVVEREHEGLRRFWDETWRAFRRDILLAPETIAEAA